MVTFDTEYLLFETFAFIRLSTDSLLELTNQLPAQQRVCSPAFPVAFLLNSRDTSRKFFQVEEHIFIAVKARLRKSLQNLHIKKNLLRNFAY